MQWRLGYPKNYNESAISKLKKTQDILKIIEIYINSIHNNTNNSFDNSLLIIDINDIIDLINKNFNNANIIIEQIKE